MNTMTDERSLLFYLIGEIHHNLRGFQFLFTVFKALHPMLSDKGTFSYSMCTSNQFSCSKIMPFQFSCHVPINLQLYLTTLN